MGSAPDDVWIFGDDGLAHFDGVGWTRHERARGIVGAWVNGRDEAWFVGGRTALRRNEGTPADVEGIDRSDDLHAVWGNGARDIWIGSTGGLLHWDGVRWERLAAARDVRALWGSRDRIWAGGPGWLGCLRDEAARR